MTSNTLRPIVVDDSDSRVKYTGRGWFQDAGSQDGAGNFGPTYQHTLHGTKSNGSFSFAFSGTSIRIFGTTNILNTTGVIDPHWECFVDNVSIGATKPFAFPENNWLLCEQKDLNDGPHEITVNVTTNGQTFWFDYLQYILSPGVSLDTAVVLVENSDPGLVFDSKWQALEGIASMTSITGSQVSFSFTGTSLIWLGIIPQELSRNPSSATFSIDGGFPKPFPLVGLPTGMVATAYNQIFFTTPPLPAGPHVLLVTYTGTTQQTPLTLDYIYVTNTSIQTKPITNTSTQIHPVTILGTTPTPSQSSVPTSQPSGNRSSSTGTIINVSTHSDQVPNLGYTLVPSQSPGPTPRPSDKRGSSIGAIVGGVIGGLDLIALILFLLWRHKREKMDKRNTSSIAIRPIEVTPFVSSCTHRHSVARGHKANLNHQRWPSITHYIHDPSSSTSSGPTSSGYNAGVVPQTREMSEHSGTAMEPVHQRMIFQDSGARLHQGRIVVVEDIPPSYTHN